MVWHPCMRKSHIVWANHTGFLFPTKLPFEVRSCEVDWKKKLIWNSDLVSLILLNFQERKSFSPQNKTTACWAVVSTEQGTSKSTSLLKPTADEASLVTTWLPVSLLKLLAMAVGCVNQANAAPGEKQCSSPINATVCVGRLLCWILLCWMWQVALAWHWESDHHGAPSCVIEILGHPSIILYRETSKGFGPPNKAQASKKLVKNYYVSIYPLISQTVNRGWDADLVGGLGWEGQKLLYLEAINKISCGLFWGGPGVRYI